MEAGESFRQAAIRECREEVGLTPVDPELRGRLFFTFSDGYRMYGEVFWAYDWSGEETETDEARPFWQSAADLPYENMWADDRLWMPQALLGNHFSAAFYFDEDELISSRMDIDFRSGPPAMPRRDGVLLYESGKDKQQI
ncbi:8-oxo-dGTP diphosphatase [Salinispira pacifica]|uniref:8-oxo-dGTP diphosphatase n=1 Tax=Salinispira pacifica TaxID=1307761 RepID=UPI00313780DD